MRTRAVTMLLASLVAAGSCKNTETVETDAPAEATFASVITFDEAGVFERSSRVVEWPAGTALDLVGPSGRTFVLAWSAADLAARGLPMPTAEPLRLATGCEQSIGSPTWIGKWEDQRIVATATSVAPRLTASWVTDACERLSEMPPFAVDMRCLVSRCELMATPVSRCRASLDMTTCGLGLVEATVDAVGGVCLDFAASNASCLPRDEPTADGAYECTEPQCGLDVYFNPSRRPPPYQADLIEVVDDGDGKYIDPLLQEIPLILPRVTFGGYLHDLLPLDDHLVVAHVPGVLPRRACPEHLADNSKLSFIDQDTLEITRTATAPPCLQRLARDPTGRGFLATFAKGDQWYVGRFDADGTKLAEADIRLPMVEDMMFWRVHQLVGIESLDLVVILVSLGRSQSLLITLDLDTLTLRDRMDAGGPMSGYFMANESDRVLVVPIAETRIVRYFDLVEGRRVFEVTLPGVFDIRESTYDLYATANETLVVGKGDSEIHAVNRSNGVIDRAALYEADTAMITIRPFRDDQFVVGGTTVGDWKAIVSIYDRSDNRFVAGAQFLGHGIVNRLRRDALGRIWAMLPWAGRIARLTPN